MKREDGFTLVELLVVMVILGLLAAVGVAGYLQQRNKASDADAKVDARTAQAAAEAILTENDGAYDGPQGVTVDNLRAVETVLNDADLSVPAVTADSYTLQVVSDTGNTFGITRNPDGSSNYDCATSGKGGCPADGTWN